MIASGTPQHVATKLIQGLLEANPRPDDERWSSRHADIPRLVQTAVDKFSPESNCDLERCNVDYSNLGEHDDAPHPHVIDRLLPKGEVTLGGGHGGSSKSYLGLIFGVHVALGLSFAGLETEQTGVAFYSAEDNVSVLRKRLRKICRALKIDHKLLEGRLFLLDVSDQDAFLHKGASGFNAKTETAQLKNLAGDSTAMRVVLEKLIPNQKPQLPPLAISIPDGSLLERANAVLDAAIKGDISPDQAASIISMGNEIARLKEFEELERRLIVLEQKAQRS
jgi:hypothetical protein